MAQSLEHGVNSKGETRRSNEMEERVPTKFFKVRFWIVLYIVVAVVYVGSHSQALLEPAQVPPELWVIYGVFAVEIILWIIALQLWAKAKLAGFWLVAVLAHMGFLSRSLMLFTGIMAGDTQAIAINAIWVIAIFFCLLVNIWSSALLGFFKRLKGVCPACRKAPLGEPRKKKSWTCKACGVRVLWLDALGEEDSNALIRFHSAVELAETGDYRAAYVEMIRFLGQTRVTGSSVDAIIDAEFSGKKLARQWEKQLSEVLLTRVGRGRRLSVTCPECRAKLKGSFDAIDGVAVCTKCRAEFALPYADSAGTRLQEPGRVE
jgi:ribosomal protein L37AE/L43A